MSITGAIRIGAAAVALGFILFLGSSVFGQAKESPSVPAPSAASAGPSVLGAAMNDDPMAAAAAAAAARADDDATAASERRTANQLVPRTRRQQKSQDAASSAGAAAGYPALAAGRKGRVGRGRPPPPPGSGRAMAMQRRQGARAGGPSSSTSMDEMPPQSFRHRRPHIDGHDAPPGSRLRRSRNHGGPLAGGAEPGRYRGDARENHGGPLAGEPAHSTARVFAAGEAGYKCIRIPSLLLAGDSLLAFAEGRNFTGDGCHPLAPGPVPNNWNRDLVLKRSLDGGASWTALLVVARSANQPTAVFDAARAAFYISTLS